MEVASWFTMGLAAAGLLLLHVLLRLCSPKPRRLVALSDSATFCDRPAGTAGHADDDTGEVGDPTRKQGRGARSRRRSSPRRSTRRSPRRRSSSRGAGRDDTPLTVCVTGGLGFLGRATVRHLLERGFIVRVLDLFEPPLDDPARIPGVTYVCWRCRRVDGGGERPGRGVGDGGMGGRSVGWVWKGWGGWLESVCPTSPFLTGCYVCACVRCVCVMSMCVRARCVVCVCVCARALDVHNLLV